MSVHVEVISEFALEQEFAQELRVPVRVVAEARRRGDIEYYVIGRQVRIPWQEIHKLRTYRRVVEPGHGLGRGKRADRAAA